MQTKDKIYTETKNLQRKIYQAIKDNKQIAFTKQELLILFISISERLRRE